MFIILFLEIQNRGKLKESCKVRLIFLRGLRTQRRLAVEVLHSELKLK